MYKIETTPKTSLHNKTKETLSECLRACTEKKEHIKSFKIIFAGECIFFEVIPSTPTPEEKTEKAPKAKKVEVKEEIKEVQNDN